MTAYDVAAALVSLTGEGGTVRSHDGAVNPYMIGYYVSGIIPSLVFDSVQDVDRGEVAWWIGLNPAPLYGAWVDDETGKVYFDGTQRFITKSSALLAGVERGEIAIWDIRKGVEVRCDETSQVEGD